jgi:hypothetical protein
LLIKLNCDEHREHNINFQNPFLLCHSCISKGKNAKFYLFTKDNGSPLFSR